MADSKTYPDTATTGDDSYWRDSFRTRPYVTTDASYDDYGPAYAYGTDAYGRHSGRKWEDVESDLGRDWDQAKGKSKLTWEHAKAAVKDAWNRMVD